MEIRNKSNNYFNIELTSKMNRKLNQRIKKYNFPFLLSWQNLMFF